MFLIGKIFSFRSYFCLLLAANRFRCIDLIIEDAAKPLTEKFIKELHRTLKNGTGDSRQPWFALGAYKKAANEAGGQATPLPSQVPAAMAKLLKGYSSNPKPDLNRTTKHGQPTRSPLT